MNGLPLQRPDGDRFRDPAAPLLWVALIDSTEVRGLGALAISVQFSGYGLGCEMTYAETYARPSRPYSCADSMRAVRATLNRPMRRPMRAMRGGTNAQVGVL